MTRDDLRTKMRTAVSRYARTIADSSSVPFSLVEELTDIADEHARQYAVTVQVVEDAISDNPENLPKDLKEMPPAESAPPSRRPRRTTDQTSDR